MLDGRMLYRVPKLFLFPPGADPVLNCPSISARACVEVTVGLFHGRASITQCLLEREAHVVNTIQADVPSIFITCLTFGYSGLPH